jgi:hypothetical protein
MAQSAVVRNLDNRAAHLLPLLRSRPSVVITDWACLEDRLSECAACIA